MKELYIRGVSGLLYVALILGTIFFNPLFFTLIILLFSSLAIVELQRLISLKSYLPIAIVYLLVYNFYQSKINTPDLLYPLVSVFIAHLFLVYWLFSKKTIPLGYLTKIFIALFYLGLGCFFIIAIAGNAERFQSKDILLFFILIWTNNSFAYLVGKQWGKKTLFPRISPKKSWEGFIGGLFFTLVTVVIYQEFYPQKSIPYYIFLGAMTTLLATLGDLIESKFKRNAKVKDSGSLLPGHGGFFDRMDSAIFTAPWFYFIINFNEYVS